MHDLIRKDQEMIWHPFTPLQGVDNPVLISAAEGVYLITSDGRKIIDAVSSWWVNLHGHSNPAIAKAVAEQALKLEHVIFAGFTHEPAIRLAQNLLSILPDNQARIFFSDDGSTAVEVAIKMAIQFWHNSQKPKKKIIALDGAYHGDTFGSMSVGERGLFTDPFRHLLFDVDFLKFPTRENGDEVVAQFLSVIKQGDVAAFIYEPLVQGAAGMRIYDAALLDRLIELARQHEVLCIADEVFTGFGRTGKLFSSDYCKNKPDIIAVSKGITGGTMPLGVTSCSDHIVNAFQSDRIENTFFHGHSYTANPLACAAANASFDLLMSKTCQQKIQWIAERHTAFVKQANEKPAVEKAESLGTILSIELKSATRTTYTNDLRKKIYSYFLTRDILLRPLGNVLYVLPPYVIEEEQLTKVYNSILEFLDTL